MTDPEINPSGEEKIEYTAPAPAEPAAESAPAEPAAPAKKKRAKWKIVLPIVIAAAVLVQAGALAVLGLFFLSDPVDSAEHALSSLFSDVGRGLPDVDDFVSLRLGGRLTGSMIEDLEGHEVNYDISAAVSEDDELALSAALTAEGADDLTLDATLTDGQIGLSFPALLGERAVSMNVKTLPDDLAHSALAPGAGTSVSLDQATFDELMQLARQAADLLDDDDDDRDDNNDETEAETGAVFDKDAWEDALKALRADFSRIARTGMSPMLTEVNGRPVLAKATVYEMDEGSLVEFIDAVNERIVHNDALVFPDNVTMTTDGGQTTDLRMTLKSLLSQLRMTASTEKVEVSLVLYESFGRLVRVDLVSTETFLDKDDVPNGNTLQDVFQLEITPGKTGRLHLVAAETQTVDDTDYCNLYLDLDFDRTKKADTLTVDMKTPSAASNGVLWMERVQIQAGIRRGKKDAFDLYYRLWIKSDRNEYPEIDPNAVPTGEITLSGTFSTARKKLSLTLSDLSVSGKPTGEGVDENVRLDGEFFSLSIDTARHRIVPLENTTPLLSMSAEELETIVGGPDNTALLEGWDNVFNGHLAGTVYEAVETASADLGWDATDELVSGVYFIPMAETAAGQYYEEFMRYDPKSKRIFVSKPHGNTTSSDILVYDAETLTPIDTLHVDGNLKAMDAYDGYLAYSVVCSSNGRGILYVLDAVTLKEISRYRMTDVFGGDAEFYRYDTFGQIWIWDSKAWVFEADQLCEFACVNLIKGRITKLGISVREPVGTIDRENGVIYVCESNSSDPSILTISLREMSGVGSSYGDSSFSRYYPNFCGMCCEWDGSFYNEKGKKLRKKPMTLPVVQDMTFVPLWMDGTYAVGILRSARQFDKIPPQVVISDEKGTICGAMPETQTIRAFLPRGDGSFYALIADTVTGTVRLSRITFSGGKAFFPH